MPHPARTVGDRDDEILRGFQSQLPSYLYRYVGIADHRWRWFEDIILRDILFLVPYRDLNDPFEGAAPFTFEATPEQVREYWRDYLIEEKGRSEGTELDAEIEKLAITAAGPAVGERLRAKLEAETSGYGVCCFSATGTDIPMWAYYADGHKGACLRFRSKDIYDPELPGCLPPIPVKYQVDYPWVSFYRDVPTQRMVSMLATKAVVWSHEQEWRIVSMDRSGPIHFNDSALDAVILGCKMSEADVERVVELLRLRSPIPDAFRVERDEGSYCLRMVPLNWAGPGR